MIHEISIIAISAPQSDDPLPHNPDLYSDSAESNRDMHAILTINEPNTSV